MTHGHPPEQVLSLYVLDPSLTMNAAEIETHLSSCASCAEAVARLREFDALLAEEDSWPEEDVSWFPRAEELRTAAARMEREDEEAEALLGPLLEGAPAAFLWADLPSKRQFRTGGVVRKLAAAADKACYSAPRHAVNLAETAISIAGMLDEGEYPASELAALRGVAWKQRANALRHLGRHPEALQSLDRAERYFRELPRPELDLASLTFIRGTLCYEQQDYPAARQFAEESVTQLTRLGQIEQFIRSRHLLGAILFELGDLDASEAIFRSIHAYGEMNGDAEWIACALQALGQCAIQRRDFTKATHMLQKALSLFDSLGIDVAKMRSKWALGIIMVRTGNHRTGASSLRSVREEFLSIGNTSDAALVTLDLMEMFLTMGNARDVQRTAGNVVSIFRQAGMLTGALTAADYLKQAAIMRAVTPRLIEYVRRYLRRCEVQPDFAFSPPPL